jgi:hypothetical protein
MSHPHIATKPQVLVTFSPPPEVRHGFAESPGALAVTTYLPDIGRNDRRRVLASADAGLSWTPDRELQGAAELGLLASAGLVQLLSAGVDVPRLLWVSGAGSGCAGCQGA